MCDAFAGLKYKVTLIIFYKKKNLKFKNIKRQYNLKNNFKIKYAFDAKKDYNFIDRCKFAFYSINQIEKKSLILSRSVITSLYLTLIKLKIYWKFTMFHKK